MALSSDGEALLRHAKAALPSWFTSDERPMEDLGQGAKLMELAKEQGEDWLGNALITQAVGPAGDDPDWLNQHARDRGTNRRLDETDAALRDRIRNIEDAVTRPALIAAAQAIVDEEGIVGDVDMVEQPRDGAYSHSNVADAGTGGTFATVSGTTRTFTPDDGWARPPLREVVEVFTGSLTIAGAAHANNDGGHTITDLSGDGAVYVDATATAEADPTCTWTAHRLDQDSNQVDGFRDAFFTRGDRFVSRGVVLILPYGSTDVTAEKVREMLRQKKGAGVPATVERRLSP